MRERYELRFGVIGWLLLLVGGVLTGYSASEIVAVLFLPAATLVMGLAALLNRRRDGKLGRELIGVVLVVSGCVSVGALGFVTPERFLGRPESFDSPRPFVLPGFETLFRLHLAWTAAALLVAIGLRLRAKVRLETTLAVGLTVFAAYPALAVACLAISTALG